MQRYCFSRPGPLKTNFSPGCPGSSGPFVICALQASHNLIILAQATNANTEQGEVIYPKMVIEWRGRRWWQSLRRGAASSNATGCRSRPSQRLRKFSTKTAPLMTLLTHVTYVFADDSETAAKVSVTILIAQIIAVSGAEAGGDVGPATTC